MLYYVPATLLKSNFSTLDAGALRSAEPTTLCLVRRCL